MLAPFLCAPDACETDIRFSLSIGCLPVWPDTDSGGPSMLLRLVAALAVVALANAPLAVASRHRSPPSHRRPNDNGGHRHCHQGH